MAITVTVIIDDTDQKILLDNLLDINQWVQDAVTGKINHSWKSMNREWINKLMNDNSFTDPMPSNKADFVTLVTTRSDYKNRTERES